MFGTLEFFSTDKTTPRFKICNIKDPLHVNDIISEELEKQRKENNVEAKEIFLNNNEQNN